MFSFFESLIFIVFPILFISIDAVDLIKEYKCLNTKAIMEDEI